MIMIDFSKDIAEAVRVMKKNGVIIYPTDTIWGIGCDATNEKAVEKIFKIKKRPSAKSLIILLDTEEKLQLLMNKVPDVAISLINQVTSPLTIIYSGVCGLAKSVYASDGTVGIRITRDPFCRELCRALDKPLISTSANISGYDYPLVFRDMDHELIKKADYVVEYGRNEVKQIKPSTIVRLKNNWEYEILRS